MSGGLVYDPTVGQGWRAPTAADLPNSGVTAATYGDATHVAQVAVNAQGVVTGASNVAITASSGVSSLDSITGAVTLVAGSNVTITDNSPSAGNITIAASGGGGFSVKDYKAQSTDLTVTATSAATAQTFITGNSVTYDGATRVMLIFYSPGITSSIGACIIELFDGSTDLGRLSQSNDPGAVPYYAAYVTTPSAAAHTFTLKAWRSNGGSTALVTGSSGGVFTPAFYAIHTF